jgi:acetoin utilization protein AcuB
MDAKLSDVQDVFEREQFHHVVVTENGRAVGVISDRDLLKRLSPFLGNKLNERKQDENTLNLKVHQVMTRNPVSALPGDTVQRAVDLILEHNFRSLPVLDEDRKPVGIISWKDILRWGSFSGVWSDGDETEATLFDIDGADEGDQKAA